MPASYDRSNVVPFFRGAPKLADWSPQELADFYKVQRLLLQHGLAIEVDRGMTDEGEPWFVFCHENGDVFLHFARLGGSYLVAGPNISEPLWNGDFSSLLKDLQERVPLALPRKSGDGATLLMHPSVLLIAAVAALFYQSSNLKAEELGEPVHAPALNADSRSNSSSPLSELQAASLIAVIALMASVEGLNVLEGAQPEFVPQPVDAAVELEVQVESHHFLDNPMLAESVISEDRPAAVIEPDAVKIDGVVALMDSVIASIPVLDLQQNLHDESAWVEIAGLPSVLFDAAVMPVAPIALAIDINIEAASKQPPAAQLDQGTSATELSAVIEEPTKRAEAPVTSGPVVFEDREVDIVVLEEKVVVQLEEKIAVVLDEKDVPALEDSEEAALILDDDKEVAMSDWQDVKVFVTFIGGTPVLIANTSFNFPQGPDAEMVALESFENHPADDSSDIASFGADDPETASLNFVGIASYGDGAFA